VNYNVKTFYTNTMEPDTDTDIDPDTDITRRHV